MGEKYKKSWKRAEDVILGKKEEKMDLVLNMPTCLQIDVSKGNYNYGFGTLQRGCGCGNRTGNLWVSNLHTDCQEPFFQPPSGPDTLYSLLYPCP